MIKLNFCKWCKWLNLEIVELQSYKDFFRFYLENAEKGCIFDVEDDGNTK